MNPMKPWFYPQPSQSLLYGSLTAPTLAFVDYSGCGLWGLNIMEYMMDVQGYSAQDLSISNPNLTLAQAVCGEINMSTDFRIPAMYMNYLGLPGIDVGTEDLDPNGTYSQAFKFQHVVSKFFQIVGEGHVYTKGTSDDYPTFLDIDNNGVFEATDREKFWCIDPQAQIEGGLYAC